MNEPTSNASGSITSGSTATVSSATVSSATVSSAGGGLPLPANGITAYRAATGTELAKIERALAEIDINDSNSILFFGTAAQG